MQIILVKLWPVIKSYIVTELGLIHRLGYLKSNYFEKLNNFLSKS